MEITITARHMVLNDNLREYIKSETLRLERFFGRIVEAHVVLKQEKFRFSSEIIITLPMNTNLTAFSESKDIRHSFDKTIQKLEMQVRRFKERLKNHREPIGRKESIVNKNRGE